MMVPIDIKKLKSFETEYFEKVYKIICRMQFDVNKCCTKKEPRMARELVWRLYSVGILGILTEETFPEKQKPEEFDTISEEKIKEYVKSLILAEPERIRKCCEELCEKTGNKEYKADISEKDTFIPYFKEHIYKSMRDLEAADADIPGGKVRFPIRIIQLLGIRTCPYCNRNFIGINKSRILGVQLDHFMNRRYYPYFSVSLYNLVPCCGVCNLNKLDKPDNDLVSPYETKVDFESAIKIYCDLTAEKVQEENIIGEQLRLEVCQLDRNIADRYKKNIDVFQLSKAYGFHETEAKSYLDRMRIYPPSQLDEFERIFADAAGMEITGMNLERDLFTSYFSEPEEYLSKPMAKFYRDLYKEYREENGD